MIHNMGRRVSLCTKCADPISVNTYYFMPISEKCSPLSVIPLFIFAEINSRKLQKCDLSLVVSIHSMRQFNCLKNYPLADWTIREINSYFRYLNCCGGGPNILPLCLLAVLDGAKPSIFWIFCLMLIVQSMYRKMNEHSV